MELTPARLDDLLQYARGLPGATLELLWGGVQVLKVEGKMFATFSAATLAYKVADEDFLALSGLPGVRPAPYLARARWISVSGTAALDTAQLQQGLAASWQLVLRKLPKHVRAAYGL
ncbi:MmcQ/YjbR family DNA-binding protein [Vogesella oryzae]|uniref:MmcQ/YjbR family DNA-binding protein n=1 Tax=Vogesella oryzae TaxID=1735285 RepID=UPI0015823547|nr:MmcQ/YjbR family DNA-binding protein [Vogesella oryzae]